MKRFNWLLIGSVILTLAMVLLVGCGVAQDEYDATVAAKEAAESRIASLQSDLDDANADIASLQSDLATTESDLATAESDLATTESDLATAESDLAEIQEVYPPKDFSSLSELKEWLIENDVSEKPDTMYAEDWYGRALEIQEDALRDGYIVSADYDATEEGVAVWCITVINGRVFYWDPETDEVFEDYSLGTVK